MYAIRLILSTFILVIFTTFAAHAQTQTVEEVTTTETTGTASPTAVTVTPSPSQVTGQAMIVSPVPSAKEVIATPSGYVSCFSVKAGWYKDSWIPEHRVCQYQATPGQTVTYEGVAWVDSYWACTGYTGTTCTKWEWKPGHWVKTLEAY